ncbi:MULTISPECIES: helix-turn-helix transcriptional regulator [Sorangium]|uniref:helix-turn-helix domain-containing protein n=1 Tax=Sorangium TaxID=39643 RepID=UPI002D1E46D4|nr:helix-turn-helix transcriptional regulator [Sorangium sp. Soce836]
MSDLVPRGSGHAPRSVAADAGSTFCGPCRLRTGPAGRQRNTDQQSVNSGAQRGYAHPVQSPSVETIMGYVGANVRRLRMKRGMTQEGLAEAVDLHLTFIQRIEAGRANLTLTTVVALASALEVAPARLLRPAKLPEVKRGRPRKAPK